MADGVDGEACTGQQLRSQVRFASAANPATTPPELGWLDSPGDHNQSVIDKLCNIMRGILESLKENRELSIPFQRRPRGRLSSPPPATSLTFHGRTPEEAKTFSMRTWVLTGAMTSP